MQSSTFLGATIAILFLACGSSNSDSSNSPSDMPDSGQDSGPEDSSPPGPPPPPTLGATQISRMGRPITNMLLNHTFDADPNSKTAAVNEYNANSAVGTWNKYVPEFENNLAVFDMLDAQCGNQALADTDKDDVTRYHDLAALLADDRLWIDTSKSTCTTYFGIENQANGIAASSDCGGRMMNYEVIKLTYTLLAGSSITDGTTPVAAKTSGTTFPYLAPTN
ncbi:MAG: hypothetical protein FWD73_07735 [Polyangiaceae bacterium]|nr:hypothetical protein [Polyangiaceae bacterium]